MEGTARIAVFIPSFRGGGAERNMVTLANGLVNRGFSVDLLVAQRIGPNREFLDPRINLIDLKVSRVLYAFLPLVQYLRRGSPEVVLSALNHADVFDNLIKILSGTRVRTVMRMGISQRIWSGSWGLNP